MFHSFVKMTEHYFQIRVQLTRILSTDTDSVPDIVASSLEVLRALLSPSSHSRDEPEVTFFDGCTQFARCFLNNHHLLWIQRRGWLVNGFGSCNY